jgi:peptide/nickel transport system substrate-binding protein
MKLGRIGIVAARALMLASLTLVSQARAQTLEAATEASPVGLDPHVATAFATIMINSNIYEGLTAIDKDLRVVPELAESWTISGDKRSYTFKLRQGVVFHNGDPFSGKDVIASVKRVLDKATGSPIASRFTNIEDISIDGSGNVVMRLNGPSAPFLAQLSALAILPEKAIAAKTDIQRSAIGTGPFKLAQWVPDTYLLLQKHDKYYRQGQPKLDAVKFNIVPEASTRQVGLSSGTYQLLPNIDPAVALPLMQDANAKVLETLDLAYSLVGMNTTRPPFDNAKVRQAVNYAIDRAKLVQAAYFGRGEPGGPLSPALTDWAVPIAEFACYKPDPAKAKALLKEAGLAEPVAVTLKVPSSNQIAVDAAQVVQAQLNQAGFKVELAIQEQGQFIQDWRNSNFDGFVSMNGGNVDPDDYFLRTFRTGGSTNVFKYTNPKLDAQLDEARSVEDKAKRQAIYKEVQQELACSGPVAHLAYGKLFTAVSKKLQGYEMIANRQTRYLREAVLTK